MLARHKKSPKRYGYVFEDLPSQKNTFLGQKHTLFGKRGIMTKKAWNFLPTPGNFCNTDSPWSKWTLFTNVYNGTSRISHLLITELSKILTRIRSSPIVGQMPWVRIRKPSHESFNQGEIMRTLKLQGKKTVPKIESARAVGWVFQWDWDRCGKIVNFESTGNLLPSSTGPRSLPSLYPSHGLVYLTIKTALPVARMVEYIFIHKQSSLRRNSKNHKLSAFVVVDTVKIEIGYLGKKMKRRVQIAFAPSIHSISAGPLIWCQLSPVSWSSRRSSRRIPLDQFTTRFCRRIGGKVITELFGLGVQILNATFKCHKEIV